MDRTVHYLICSPRSTGDNSLQDFWRALTTSILSILYFANKCLAYQSHDHPRQPIHCRISAWPINLGTTLNNLSIGTTLNNLSIAE